MPVTEDSIDIEAAPEIVWDYLIDPDKSLLWQQSMLEVEREDTGEPQKGSRSHGVVKVAGRRLSWTSEITEIEPPRRITFRSIESPVAFVIEQTLEHRDGGTRLHFRNDTPSLGSFWGKLADPVVQKMYAKSLRADLEALKALVEGEAR